MWLRSCPARARLARSPPTRNGSNTGSRTAFGLKCAPKGCWGCKLRFPWKRRHDVRSRKRQALTVKVSGLGFDQLSQGVVDPVLPAGSLLAKVVEYVAVDAQRDELLGI